LPPQPRLTRLLRAQARAAGGRGRRRLEGEGEGVPPVRVGRRQDALQRLTFPEGDLLRTAAQKRRPPVQAVEGGDQAALHARIQPNPVVSAEAVGVHSLLVCDGAPRILQVEAGGAEEIEGEDARSLPAVPE